MRERQRNGPAAFRNESLTASLRRTACSRFQCYSVNHLNQNFVQSEVRMTKKSPSLRQSLQQWLCEANHLGVARKGGPQFDTIQVELPNLFLELSPKNQRRALNYSSITTSKQPCVGMNNFVPTFNRFAVVKYHIGPSKPFELSTRLVVD